jgi:type II restriction enzyme
MSERVQATNNPNLMLLNYDLKQFAVTNLFVVPKHFFVQELIEKRKPLRPSAQRAGWVGCNILLSHVPESGKIFIVRNGLIQPKENVLEQWRRTLFLRDQSIEARGWLVEVMRCVEAIGKQEFQLDDVYAFENVLSGLYPNNRHVRQKFDSSFKS